MFVVMYGRMIFSMILEMGESSEIGLYEVPRPGSLFGFGYWDDFGQFPDLRVDVLIQGEIEDLCEVVYGHRAEMLSVSYIHVIRSS